MKKSIVRITFVLLLGAALLLVLSFAGPVQAGNPDLGIFPKGSQPYGQTYGYWGGQWWKWVLEAPAPINPVLDTTGKNCGVGQSGPVWFLAGTFGGKAERKCTVTKDKALLIPIYNTGWIATEPGDTAHMARKESKLAMDKADPSTFSVTIDGVAVKHLERFRLYQGKLKDLPIYYVTLPEENVAGLPAGAYGPASADGYYLMLEPLKRGRHWIHISVTGFLDVWYNLEVK